MSRSPTSIRRPLGNVRAQVPWLRVGLLAAAAGLVVLGCSGDDSAEPAPATVAGETVERDAGIDDAEAEARTAAIEYFEALGTLDLAVAQGRSSGSAATLVRWIGAVNGVEEVRGTPQEAAAAPSPSTTVSITEVAEAGDGRYRAEGHLRLDAHPPALTPGPLPPADPAADPAAAPPTGPLGGWYVTELSFTRDGDRLLVDDFRFDDSPYPVSELVADFEPAGAAVVVADETGAASPPPAPAVAGGIAAATSVELGHRELDGTVQYVLRHGATDLRLAGAEVFDGAVPA